MVFITNDPFTPEKTMCTNVDLMLAHRLRRWPNIKPLLVQKDADKSEWERNKRPASLSVSKCVFS